MYIPTSIATLSVFVKDDSSMILSNSSSVTSLNLNLNLLLVRDVLFEIHLKFWNTTSFGVPAKSLL